VANRVTVVLPGDRAIVRNVEEVAEGACDKLGIGWQAVAPLAPLILEVPAAATTVVIVEVMDKVVEPLDRVELEIDELHVDCSGRVEELHDRCQLLHEVPRLQEKLLLSRGLGAELALGNILEASLIDDLGEGQEGIARFLVPLALLIVSEEGPFLIDLVGAID